MKNEIYYIPENIVRTNDAGSKAREDVDTVLRRCELKPLLTMDYNLLAERKSKFKLSYWRLLFLLCTVKNKWIILQYPVYSGKIIKKALELLLKNNHLVLFIHDLEYLRYKDSRQEIKKEIDILNQSDIIVSHNSCMTKRLRQDGVTTPIIELQLFDYLLNTPVPKNLHKLGKQILFAGNLRKSSFLKMKILGDLSIDFILYGSGFDENEIKQQNIRYSGSFQPDEIPYKLKGSFGLIWDGNSIDSCDGKTGEYMRYNNPHKLSLYIMAGLPVIVWEDAAVAHFVKRYNIGLTVNSLRDISTKISNTTQEEYGHMLSNIYNLQEKIITGFFTKDVLQKIDNMITKYKKDNDISV